MYVDTEKINYIDLISKAIGICFNGLIPFLEHDDAAVHLMGANMQRQAVPLFVCKHLLLVLVWNKKLLKHLVLCITAKRAGVVEYVSSEKIIIRADEHEFRNIEDWISQGIDTYYLRKFQRSSYSTWIHHTPIVKLGEEVKAGDILLMAHLLINGELALGSNFLLHLCHGMDTTLKTLLF